MAPQQQHRTTAFLLFPCLLVLMSSPLSSSQFCTTELEACSGDEDCKACLESWPVGALATCSEYYTTDSSTEAGEPMFEPDDGSCEEMGVMNCCGFESGTAETCMENDLLEAFWSCNVEGLGCTIDDMPCSPSAVAAKAEADAVEDAEEGATDVDSSASLLESCRYGAALAAVAVVVLASGL
eukprot:g5850.t1